LLLYSSYLPLGVPNWTVIHINHTASISGLSRGGTGTATGERGAEDLDSDPEADSLAADDTGDPVVGCVAEEADAEDPGLSIVVANNPASGGPPR
jgi:hypothetical protein